MSTSVCVVASAGWCFELGESSWSGVPRLLALLSLPILFEYRFEAVIFTLIEFEGLSSSAYSFYLAVDP